LSGGILAIDLGTSVLKAVLFDPAGRLVATASRPIATLGSGGVQEQDPQSWWEAARAALAQLPGRHGIGAIVLTGSMQNLIVCDRAGKPLAPAVLYSDRRMDAAAVDALSARLPGDYAQRTGNRLDPAHVVLKLLAPGRFLPEAARNGARRLLFGAKDALILRMTEGEAAIVDPTTASTTGLMSIDDREWDEGLIAICDADPAELPRIVPADAVVGHLAAAPAAELGLATGLPILCGAGDAAAATWGAFADRPGTAYAYLGTTGWVAATQAMHDARPPRDIYTLADPVHRDRAVLISPFLTAGAALDWAAALAGFAVDRLLAEAAAVEEGTAPPLFLPYLGGERAPFEDSRVRGAFLGLDRSHGPGAMGLAVVEGIAFAVRHNLETAGLPPAPLTVIGGAARTALQQQVLADVLDREIRVPADGQELTAFGALRMAAATLGLALDESPDGRIVRPRPERRDRAERRYEAYLAASSFARQQAEALG
jgi:xylulokinase